MRSEPDLTSVIIPCYNQAHFLGEALESAFAQTCPPHEVIVVDDGSTDDTSEVAARFARVRSLSQKNRGLAAARNSGFKASRGNFLVFLDADDRLLPNALEDGIEALNVNPNCAFAYGHVKLIATDGSPLPTPPQNAVDGDPYAELLRHNYIWTAGAVMYRRTTIASVQGFNPLVDASADFDLNARIGRQFPFCCSDKTVLEYRSHDKNMSRDCALMLDAAITARRLQWKYVRGSPQYEQALRAGIRRAQEVYGERLIDRIRDNLTKRRWGDALSDSLVALRYYPQGLLRRAAWKLNVSR